MRTELILLAVILFIGPVWLVPSQIMLATANRRFRHLTFHQFTKAAAFPYHAMRRLLLAAAGTGAVLVLAALPNQSILGIAACSVVFVCILALYLSDMGWIEREADRLEQEGLDKPRR